MKSNQTPTRIRKEVAGVIDANAIYDTAAVMNHCGIGRVQLIELRANGTLQAGKSADGRQWYRGSDLIALIFSDRQKHRRAS
jgi:hypothetical protein